MDLLKGNDVTLPMVVYSVKPLLRLLFALQNRLQHNRRRLRVPGGEPFVRVSGFRAIRESTSQGAAGFPLTLAPVYNRSPKREGFEPDIDTARNVF